MEHQYHSSANSGSSNGKRPPLGNMARFRAAVGMMTKGMKNVASTKGTSAFTLAMKKKKQLDREGRGSREDGTKIAKVMREFKEGELHSGGSSGPVVKDRRQAIAIALSEQRRADRKT